MGERLYHNKNTRETKGWASRGANSRTNEKRLFYRQQKNMLQLISCLLRPL